MSRLIEVAALSNGDRSFNIRTLDTLFSCRVIHNASKSPTYVLLKHAEKKVSSYSSNGADIDPSPSLLLRRRILNSASKGLLTSVRVDQLLSTFSREDMSMEHAVHCDPGWVACWCSCQFESLRCRAFKMRFSISFAPDSLQWFM